MIAPRLGEAGFAVLQELVSLKGLSVDGGHAGLRQIHRRNSAASQIANSTPVRNVVAEVLGPRAQLVRSVLFDKTAEQNWGVPWHQDLTIAVKTRKEIPGFIGWSIKDGIHHVQAPSEILETMLTVRIHLDDCGVENGPLKVLPGTHKNGWLNAEQIQRLRGEISETICTVSPGGAILMRPLLLHASSKAMKPQHRRVLHLEFAASELPGGLEWQDEF